jgi:hypothetical protein
MAKNNPITGFEPQKTKTPKTISPNVPKDIADIIIKLRGALGPTKYDQHRTILQEYVKKERKSGKSCNAIATMLTLPLNTVKGFAGEEGKTDKPGQKPPINIQMSAKPEAGFKSDNPLEETEDVKEEVIIRITKILPSGKRAYKDYSVSLETATTVLNLIVIGAKS